MKKHSKNWRVLDFLLLIIFVLSFYWIHWQSIFQVPALNYDEVRAGNYTHAIAFSPGSWPFHGSNSYTVVLASYWAAPFYKLFGGGILPLRLSGIISVFLGILLISVALSAIGKKSAARIFPFLVTFWPALFINHRYGIEANTFHVLCLGGLLWGLAKRNWPVIALATVAGILTHPFFIAPALAILILILKKHRTKKLSLSDQNWILGLLVFFLFYFIQIGFLIPEKFKAIGLIALDLGLILCLMKRWPTNQFIAKQKKAFTFVSILFYIVSGIATVFVLTYSSSFWSLQIATGLNDGVGLRSFELFLLALIFGSACSAFFIPVRNPLFLSLVQFFLITNFVCLLILIQPSSRCFELSLILLAVLVAWVLGEFRQKIKGIWIFSWILLGCLQWNQHYLKPILEQRTERKLLRFLFVKGVTETYPSAQTTLSQIASQDCSLDGVPKPDLDLWRDAMVFLNGANRSVLPSMTSTPLLPHMLPLPLARTDCKL